MVVGVWEVGMGWGVMYSKLDIFSRRSWIGSGERRVESAGHYSRVKFLNRVT